MRHFYVCVFACTLIALSGCNSNETSLATEGATAEDIAKYEADLAKANSEDAGYDDEEEE